MRKYLALIVGLAFASGGGWFLGGAGFVMVRGCYLLWETVRDWKKTEGRQ